MKKDKKWAKISIVLFIAGMFLFSIPIIVTALSEQDLTMETLAKISIAPDEPYPAYLIGFENVPRAKLTQNNMDYADQKQESDDFVLRCGNAGLWYAQNVINTGGPLTGFDLYIKRTSTPTDPLFVGLKSDIEAEPFNAADYDYLWAIYPEMIPEGAYTWVSINLEDNGVEPIYDAGTQFQIVLLSEDNAITVEPEYNCWALKLGSNDPKPEYVLWLWWWYYDRWDYGEIAGDKDICFRTYTRDSGSEGDNGDTGGDQIDLPPDNGGSNGGGVPAPPDKAIFQWPFICELIGFCCFIGSTVAGLKYRKVI